jgi:glutamate-1-semialdehyde 2,1-aminomutase
MVTVKQHIGSADAALRQRAQRVIPGGMYGHLNTSRIAAGMPQFFSRAQGCYIWDVDGNEYIDFMCSWGPIVLGHGDAEIEQAAEAQRQLGDCLNGPGPVMVELAELLTATVRHADWAMFAKNGTDATSYCVALARMATGKRKILMASGAYHGTAPWCNPTTAGMLPDDRAHVLKFRYNDLESVRVAVAEAGDDFAGIVVCPFRHDVRFDQEMVDPAFARGLRAICDAAGAALIIDEVRAAFRLHHGGSWEDLGVKPDLSAWSKAMGNGYPIAAMLGTDAFRTAATQIFATGSFWFAAVPMAAAIATIKALKERNAVHVMEATGTRLREGLASQAEHYGLAIRQTGPVQIPFMTFANDPDFVKAEVFARVTAAHGAYVHPTHNWFLSTAHTSTDIDRALQATEQGFLAVRRQYGEG